MLETRSFKSIFGPKREEVTACSRNFDKKLYNLYSSSNIITVINSRRVRWGWHVTRKAETKNSYKTLVGKPENMKPLRRHKLTWKISVKMDIRQMERVGGNWTHLAQDRDQLRAIVYKVMNFRVQLKWGIT
jgi:hypothetical protein